MSRFINRVHGADEASIAVLKKQNAELVEALRKIAEMTDVEADFDGFEARQTATDALAKIGGEA